MSTTYQGDRTTGFASPAADDIEATIDLIGEVLDLRRPSRYPVRVDGDILASRAIRHDDILVVDSALPPRAGCIVIASVGDDFRVCELVQREGRYWLRSSSSSQNIPVDEEADVSIWAVVTGLIRTDV